MGPAFEPSQRGPADEAAEPPDVPSAALPNAAQRRSRRLSDKILLTFHAACDVREFSVARQLLATLEDMMQRLDYRTPVDQRRSTEALVAAHERLWHLTNETRLS